MTPPLYLAAPYQREADARVLTHMGEAVIVDTPLFYPRGGGQPGDSGHLEWPGGRVEISEAVKGEAGTVLLLCTGALPAVGTQVIQHLNWATRHRHMRVHTALHLLSVVIPLPVTGGQITAEKGRLDFNMPEPPEDVEALNEALNALIARDLPVSEDWITDAELAANPGLIKTMSVSPPTEQGRVRLIRIGAGAAQVDLQPCGGTHVARTGEIGPVRIGKIENKGRQNRRVHLLLEG